MNKLILSYLFISAFLALVLVAAYSLLLAGGKYNGENLSPEAIYERAIKGQPDSVPEKRIIDENSIKNSEMLRLKELNEQIEKEVPVYDPNPTVDPALNNTEVGSYPYNSGQ